MKIEISRSFSKKTQVKPFEPAEWFCAAKTEIETLPGANEVVIKKQIEMESEKLNQFCVNEVEKAEQLYLTPPEKVGKFDENAPANIKEDPIWLKYKKPYDKLNFAGNKDIKENSKTDSELDTEQELTPEELIMEEQGIS